MKFWTFFVACALFVVAAKMSYDDEMAAQANYCKMIKEKNWPDFRKGEINCD